MPNQFDPTNPIETAGSPSGGGGLSAAAPPPGVVPRPATSESIGPLGFSMNPGEMMKALQMSTVPDEDIRRLKFLSGMGAPTRSGNWGESLSNANAAYADTAQKQKELMAQYGPMMMQHLVQMQGNLITQRKNQSEMEDKWGGTMDSSLGGLLLSKPDTIDPGMIAHTIFAAGNAHGVPAAKQYEYFSDLMAQKDPLGAIKNKVFGHLPADSIAKMGFPEYEPHVDPTTGSITYVSKGFKGINEPTQGGTTNVIHMQPNATTGQNDVYYGGTLIGPAGDPATHQKVTQIISGGSGATTQSGVAPPSIVPGTRGGYSSADPNGDRLKILNEELQNPNLKPEERAALQREIANTGAPGGAPAAYGQPQAAVPSGPPPDLAPFYGVRRANLPGPSKNDVENEAQTTKNFGDMRNGINSEVASAGHLVDRMNILTGLLNQGVQTGGFFDTRVKTASELRDFTMSLGLLNENDANALANKLSGNQVAAETFAKNVIPMMLAELKSEIASPQSGSFGGQRFTQMEWAKMIEAIANGSMTPGAIKNLQMLSQRGYAIASDHQAQANKWWSAYNTPPDASGNRLDLSRFDEAWNNRLQTNGTLKTNIDLNGVQHEVRTTKGGVTVSRPVGSTGPWTRLDVSKGL